MGVDIGPAGHRVKEVKIDLVHVIVHFQVLCSELSGIFNGKGLLSELEKEQQPVPGLGIQGRPGFVSFEGRQHLKAKQMPSLLMVIHLFFLFG